MAITAIWLKNNHGKPRESVLEKADRDGLSVRVTKTGKIIFQFRFRFQGKAARMDLGTYPLMSIKEAREAAQIRRSQLEEGHDPRTRREVERAAHSAALTNEAVYRLWHDKFAAQSKAAASEILRSFELHVFPEIGHLPADETDTPRWMVLLESIRDGKTGPNKGKRAGKPAPQIASRVLTNAQQCHKWARRWGYMTQQPLLGMTARSDLNIYKTKSSGRALSDEEIAVVLEATDRSRMAMRSKLFVKLLLFFGCRPGELRTARVEEFDFENMVWEIPPERHKTGAKTNRPLRRPIIEEVVPLLEEAMALSLNPKMLFSAESGPQELGDRATLSYPTAIMNVATRQLGVPLAHLCLYDLRKTARTNWSPLGPPHVCEVMLGHSLPGVWQVYDRHDYLTEQRAIYRQWWEKLREISASRRSTCP